MRLSDFKRFKFMKNLFFYISQYKLSSVLPIKLKYYPVSMEIEVSTACNLACPACLRPKANKSHLNHFTTVETMEKIKPILPYMSGVTFVGSYGEPFLNKGFWKLHKIASDSGTKVYYVTNGMLVKDEDIENTIKYKTTGVMISLDSLDPKLFEKIKKGAKFDKVVETLKKYIAAKKRSKHNLEVSINVILQPSNINKIYDFIKFAKKEGIDLIWFNGMIAHHKNYVKDTLLEIDIQTLKKTFKKVKRFAKQMGVKIRLPSIDQNFSKRKICCIPWNFIHLYYNGDICACTHFRQAKPYYQYVKNGRLQKGKIEYPPLILGNINQEDIRKIWNNLDYQRLRSNFKQNNCNKPCSNCYFPYGWH